MKYLWSLIAPLIIYLLSAFVNAGFNITTWTQDARAFSATLMFVALLILLIIIDMVKTKKG